MSERVVLWRDYKKKKKKEKKKEWVEWPAT